ncbi:hypothetical protein MNQ98_06135 [Paenibacillus sp. N3/727]|uniref:hypothetical protein n=1 Tax=Paenibacillus sp. N3/727 TaxID=2925845 RepID=UPI001F52DED4|nr:hypothetical protein [Paenibacillus sp. N3/727]UNK19608.1 hypothetical protein MNQ98_06135 [Paenibacillus sp. N3/727]
MYIQYTMDQFCLPKDLEEDILQNHLVRIVNATVNRLDDKIFQAAYPVVVEIATTARKKSSIAFFYFADKSYII